MLENERASTKGSGVSGRPAVLFRSLKPLDPPLRRGARGLRAWADLIVVDGDPQAQFTLLEGQGRQFAAIIKGDRFHKDRPRAS